MKFIHFSAILLIITAITACGGGGGGTTPAADSGSSSYFVSLNTAVFSPNAVARGGTLTVSWNASSNTPQNGYRIDFYLSIDTTLSDDDAWMFGSNCWTGMEGFTGCGGNGDGSVSGAVPRTVTAGQYYLLIALSYYDASFNEQVSGYYLNEKATVN